MTIIKSRKPVQVKEQNVPLLQLAHFTKDNMAHASAYLHHVLTDPSISEDAADSIKTALDFVMEAYGDSFTVVKHES